MELFLIAVVDFVEDEEVGFFRLVVGVNDLGVERLFFDILDEDELVEVDVDVNDLFVRSDSAT